MVKIIFFILIGFYCNGQIATMSVSPIYTVSGKYTNWKVYDRSKLISCYKILITDDEFNLSAGITCDSVGKVVIKGNEMFIIRMLLERIIKIDNELKITQGEFDSFIRLSVAYTNHLPNEYRSQSMNCQWTKYNAFLKSKGYKLIEVKNKTHNCK
jgi:hypothetical protein